MSKRKAQSRKRKTLRLILLGLIPHKVRDLLNTLLPDEISKRGGRVIVLNDAKL